MRGALVVCAALSSMTVAQAWWGGVEKLDGKSCLLVQQGINNATGAAAQGNWEDAIEFETAALDLLEIKGAKENEPRQWKTCDTSEGYDNAKHAYLHFRLAVALQEQGRPDDALRNFDHARTFDKDMEVDAMLNMGLLSLHLNRLADAEIHLTNVVRAFSKLSEISSERRDREGENEGVLRAMSALGDVYARQMRVDQAKNTYKRVLQATPDDTQTLLKLGSLQQWLGGLRHEPMHWVDALTAHASALRTPKMKAASEEGLPKSEEDEEKQGASLAAAYRSAPEIHLRMAGLLELVANHGTTGRGLVEAQEHIASALEMVDTGTALGWRALFTQLRLDTRLCAWQQLRSQTAVTADFLHTALHTRPPTEDETAEAIAAAEMAAAKAEAAEVAAEKEMKKLTSRERKKQRKEAARQKKKNAKTLEQLLAAQEALASGLSTGNVPIIPLTPFELWELPYVSEVGTLAAAAARAQGADSTAQQQLVAVQARLNASGMDTQSRTSSALTPRFTGGVRVPENRRVQVAVLFPSWWNDSFLRAFLAMLRALADTKQLEMIVYNLAGDATEAAAAIKALCEETYEATDGAITMVEGGYLDDPTTLASLSGQGLDVMLDLQGHLPAARPGLLPAKELSNLTGVDGREIWRLAVPMGWAATAASLTVVADPAGNSSTSSSDSDSSSGSVAGGPHGLIADRISAPPEMSWHYAEDLHHLDVPWPWGWDEGDVDAASRPSDATSAAGAGKIRARAAHGVSPYMFDVWVQIARRTHDSSHSKETSEHEQELELMVVEVLEEARPQLRNESHARGYTTLGFEVGPPPPPPSLASEETAPLASTVILESSVECATPKLTSLRRALVQGSSAVILPGQGMCSRAAAAAAVSLGRGFAPLVASYKEYEDLGVALASPTAREQAAESETKKHPAAWGPPPPRWAVAGATAVADKAVTGAQERSAEDRAIRRWATEAASLLRSGGVLRSVERQ